MMRAFLIDPERRVVREVVHSGELVDMYRVLRCRSIDALSLERSAYVYVDDDARRKPLAPVSFWINASSTGGQSWGVTGRGLVCGGPDRHGVETAAPFRLEEMRAMVYFPVDE